MTRPPLDSHMPSGMAGPLLSAMAHTVIAAKPESSVDSTVATNCCCPLRTYRPARHLTRRAELPLSNEGTRHDRPHKA
jgi:hypothetical protein